jgi:Sec-independent protein translocase protein TatA
LALDVQCLRHSYLAEEGRSVDLFGVSPLEIIVVMLIALLVLGPAKSVEVGRNIGKFWVKAQKTLREIADAATAELDKPEPSLKPAPLPEPEGAVARDRPDVLDGEEAEEEEDEPATEAAADEPQEARRAG